MTTLFANALNRNLVAKMDIYQGNLTERFLYKKADHFNDTALFTQIPLSSYINTGFAM